jgi:hypothetical protein
MTLTKFGRGRDTYAFRDSSGDHPAHADGLYRTAQFVPSVASQAGYTLPVNAAGQVGNGGDSGGPDRVTNSAGGVGAIAGVQSQCHRTGVLSGEPANWDWTTGIDWCTGVSVWTIRDQIRHAIQERPCAAEAAGCGIVEISRLLLLN